MSATKACEMNTWIEETAPVFAPEFDKDVILSTPDMTVSGRVGEFSKSGLLWFEGSTEAQNPASFRSAEGLEQYLSVWLFTKGRAKVHLPNDKRIAVDKNNILHAGRLFSEGVEFEVEEQGVLDLLSISIPLWSVANWFGGRLPNELRSLVKDEAPEATMDPISNGYTMQACAAQIESYGEPMRTLARESFAMQMMTSYLHELCGSDARNSSLSSREVRAAKDARERLLIDLSNPPSTSELAQIADMTERRLDYAFRELFGVSIFKMLTNARLDYAYQAILTRKTSIKELAFYLGYKHSSSFSQAFRKRFGKFPSQIG